MSKSVRVKIGGKDYNLRSDDEEKARVVAEQVDMQMQSLRNRINEQSTVTLSVMTALNIAERDYDCRRQQNADTEYVVTELDKMMQMLNSCYSEDPNQKTNSLF